MHLDGFDLLELKFDSGVQVSRVRDQATGQIFQVHAFHGEMLAEFDRICALLPGIPADVNIAVEAARGSNAAYIRTVPLPDGVGIVQWAANVTSREEGDAAARIYGLAVELKMRRQAGRRT
jgi:hypothetical protein